VAGAEGDDDVGRHRFATAAAGKLRHAAHVGGRKREREGSGGGGGRVAAACLVRLGGGGRWLPGKTRLRLQTSGRHRRLRSFLRPLSLYLSEAAAVEASEPNCPVVSAWPGWRRRRRQRWLLANVVHRRAKGPRPPPRPPPSSPPSGPPSQEFPSSLSLSSFLSFSLSSSFGGSE
jgi:hypothetical protein